MKKLFPFPTLLFMFLALNSTAQVRNINLEVKLLDPKPNDILYITKQFDITTQIKNLGPDTITTNDTAAWYLSFNGGQIQFGSPPVDHIDYPTPDLLPGDSAQVRIQFTVGQGWTTGSNVICSKMMIRNTANPIMDSDTTNNISCVTTEIRDPLSVKNISQTVKDLKVYPNPANKIVYFDITLNATTDVIISIMDITGKSIVTNKQKGLTQGQHKIKLALGDLPTGNYIYKVNTKDKVLNGKLFVQ